MASFTWLRLAHQPFGGGMQAGQQGSVGRTEQANRGYDCGEAVPRGKFNGRGAVLVAPRNQALDARVGERGGALD